MTLTVFNSLIISPSSTSIVIGVFLRAALMQGLPSRWLPRRISQRASNRFVSAEHLHGSPRTHLFAHCASAFCTFPNISLPVVESVCQTQFLTFILSAISNGNAQFASCEHATIVTSTVKGPSIYYVIPDRGEEFARFITILHGGVLPIYYNIT